MTWHATDRRLCAELAAYHRTFPERSQKVRDFVSALIASGVLRQPRPPAPQLNDNEDYELRGFPFESFVNGCRSPGD
jgi:hypothetical protein